jgi:nitroimidazol reductase NimA-like FMN-containing flavoprotein (pyridoxamine 5'-phosphate oxidase superfamily)
LEVSFQYECVIAYGKIRVIEKMDEKRDVLNGLLQKYFGKMESGKDFRPITDEELKQTSVYGIKIDAWNGKRNWMAKADQAENGEWPDLALKWFDFY